MKIKIETFRQETFPIDPDAVKQIDILDVQTISGTEVENPCKIPILYCEFSNIVFLEFCPTEETANNLYIGAERRLAERIGAKSRERVRRIMRVLRSSGLSVPDKPKLLEIGCGFGFNVSSMAAKLRGVAYGIEPSMHVSEICEENGVKLIGNDISAIGDSGIDFDIVIMIQSLEHIIDPNKCIEMIKSSAKPGMIFLIEVPDVQVTTNVSVWHPFCYSPRGLHLLLNRHGFRVLACNSRITDKRQFTDIDLAAVYTGGIVEDQGSSLTTPKTVEEFVADQLRLNPSASERKIRDIAFRWSVSMQLLKRRAMGISTD